MKRLNFLCIGMILCVFASYAQPSYNWGFGIGSTGNYEIARHVLADTAGNTYVTGTITATTDIDPGPGVQNLVPGGSSDAYLAKYDPSGNLTWAFNYAGTWANGRDLAEDAAGNIYLCGSYFGTVDVDPGVGTAILSSPSSIGCFIAKYDPSGNYISVINIAGTANVVGVEMTLDNSGNILVTGGFEGTADFDPGPGVQNVTSTGNDDIFVAKYTASGNYVFAFGMGTTGNEGGQSIATDPSGNVVVVGSFRNTIDFDPGAGTANRTSAGFDDAFVAKYDPSGNYIWAFDLGSSTSDGNYIDVDIDGSGNIYIGSNFTGWVDFDPGPPNQSLPSSGGAAFVAKYSPAGAYQWAFSIDASSAADWIHGLYLDNAANIYITGGFVANADFDPSASVALLNGLGAGVFVASYDASGNYRWATNFGGSNSRGEEVTADTKGGVFITGRFGGTMDLDAGPGTQNISVVGSIDGFFTKYSGCTSAPSQPGSITGPTTICQGSTNTYRATNDPNATSYTWTLPGGWTGTSTVDSIVATASATSGTVSVTANNSCGSSTAQTLSVTVNTVPGTPAITASGSTTICSGNSVLLTSSSATGNQWYLNGSPIVGAVNQTHAATAAGNYTVIVTQGGCGSAASSAITVTVNPLPTVTATGTATICDGDATTLSAAGANTYTWDQGAGTGTPVSVSPSTTTIYTVTGTDLNNCSDTAKVTVTVNPLPNVTATGTATICDGDATTLAAAGANTYTWDQGAGTGTPVSVSPSTTTIYTVTGTDLNNCSDTAKVTVTVNPLPTVTATGTATICDGDVTTLSAAGANTYTWDQGAGTGTPVSVSPSTTTIYTVTGTDLNNCSDTAKVTVTVNPLPSVSLSAYSPDTVCSVNPSFPLPAGTPTGGSYSGTGVSGGTFDPSLSGTGSFYTVYTYTDGNSCANSDSTMITVEVCTGIDRYTTNGSMKVYPNPTTDVVNVILPDDAPAGQVSILDPMGKLVFDRSAQVTRLSIDVSGYARGIYLLRFQTEEIVTYEKIIVE